MAGTFAACPRQDRRQKHRENFHADIIRLSRSSSAQSRSRSVSPLGKRHAGARLEFRKSSRPNALCLPHKHSRLKGLADGRRSIRARLSKLQVRNRSTPRNDDTISAPTFLIGTAPPLRISRLVRHVRKDLSPRRQALNLLLLSRHRGYGRACCSRDPVMTDPNRSFKPRP